MEQKKRPNNIFPLLFIVLSLTLVGCVNTSSSSQAESSNSSESSEVPTSEEPSSEPSVEEPTYYSVMFDSGGASFVSEQTLESGKQALEPSVYKLGYTLTGWYLEDQRWDFARDSVSDNITLVARWTEDEKPLITNLPIVDIDLKGETLVNVNRNDYVDSIISLTNSDGHEDISRVKAEFRG